MLASEPRRFAAGGLGRTSGSGAGDFNSEICFIPSFFLLVYGGGGLVDDCSLNDLGPAACLIAKLVLLGELIVVSFRAGGERRRFSSSSAIFVLLLFVVDGDLDRFIESTDVSS